MGQALYFVEENHGPKIGRAFRELDRDSNSRTQVLRDIVGGQIEAPVCVLEVIADEHVVNDITSEIASEVREILTRIGEPCPERLVDFIERHTVGFVRRAA